MAGAQNVQKNAQLTERKKEQDRVHARFIGSAAARRRRQAWQRGGGARLGSAAAQRASEIDSKVILMCHEIVKLL